MLLPSAFPFEALHQTRQSISAPSPPPSSPGGFPSLSSCRALQAILGSRPASPFPLTLSTGSQQKRDDPAHSNQSKVFLRTPLRPLTQNTQVTRRNQKRPQVKRPILEPRRTNKRTRRDFESTDENSFGAGNKADGDYLSLSHCVSATGTATSMFQADRDSFSTPKRRRRVPLLMPLGLSAEDFEGLDAAQLALPNTPQEEVREALHMSAGADAARDQVNGKEWTAADDHVLVATVLDKLKLSRKDWNHCAERSERDSDSLGKRWRALVGDGEIALRRGSGGRTRPELRGDWTEARGV